MPDFRRLSDPGAHRPIFFADTANPSRFFFVPLSNSLEKEPERGLANRKSGALQIFGTLILNQQISSRYEYQRTSISG
jgi:hypothetical protein